MVKRIGVFLFLLKGVHYLLAASLVAAAFLFIGCSEQEAQGGGFSMPPMPVEVAQVKMENVADKFEAVGTIEAIEEITVVSEIDAAVISLPFEEGGFIKKGQLIAQLDDSQPEAEVVRSNALYMQSESTHKRVKQVVDQKAGTAQDLDDASANMKVAEANLSLAKARYNKTRIIAPFSGLIGARRVSVGSFLRAGDQITELANLNEIRVTFSAPERYLAQLKRGAEVTITSPVYRNHEVKGKIIVIEPILDAQTRSARIVAQVQNPGQKFRPGMSANVSVILTERAEAVTIPSEAVFASGNQSFVFIVNPDSSVVRTTIKTGLQLSDIVEVTEGLERNMQVVRAGHQKLFDGARVIPVMSNDPALAQKDSSSAL
ncbi:MAG: efflux RND transporter periplasmic adaptor subunit [Ignavibacteriaceae bacterium]